MGKTLWHDLRIAVRGLRREPGFVIIAVLILGLGIAANVAVFSVVDAILLRPLPFPQPQRLVWMGPTPKACGLSCETYTVDAYEEFTARNHAFQQVAAFMPFSSPDNVRLTGHGEPQPATAMAVSANFFQALGVAPLRGRLFHDGEDRQGSAAAVLLSYPYWRRQFQGNEAVVGSAIELDGSPVTVAGVLPGSFDFGSVFWPGNRVDIFTVANRDGLRTEGNVYSWVGRLRPGVSVASAQADANRVLPTLDFFVSNAATHGYYRRRPMHLETLKEYVSGRLRRSLILLWCAVGVVLLIACVNLANLVLARVTARSKETAVRAALGASRGRLAWHSLVESLVLTAAGAALGLGLAEAIVVVVRQRAAMALPLLGTVRLDGAGLVWTLLVAVLAVALFGLAPALHASSGDPQRALQDAGAGAGASPRHERARAAMMVAEAALACLLLVTAGLLLRSFSHVLDIDLGFAPSHASAIKLDYDTHNFDPHGGRTRLYTFFQSVVDQIHTIPGVEAAGVTDFLPLGRNRAWGPVGVAGKVYRPGELPSPFVYMVTPGYFSAIGMRVHGRDFAWADGEHTQPVIVLNHTAAQYLWPGGNAIGALARMNGETVRVVGVLDDVRTQGVESQPGWQVYFPISQEWPDDAQLVVRSSLPPSQLTPNVMAAVRGLNPNQPSTALQPVEAMVARSESPRRFFAMLVACFAALGMALAALGIYGVISYSVTRSRREIGIRMALGASATHVQQRVMARTLRLALSGIAIGALASLVVARGMASLLYQVAPDDPLTFAGAIVILAVVAALAGYLPARRASRTNPTLAMRPE